jgi:3',5'-cyclic AMP phosphodiesterase CpdA
VLRDPRIDELATDPDARVMVFIDGQNLYKTCAALFGHPLCHPHLVAECLAGPRTTNRVACRFYTGRPDHNIPGERLKARNLDRRLDAMGRVGVTVVKRRLRYHWDWGHRQPLPQPAPGIAPQAVTMEPWQRPQEKGIDLAIGLDVIEFALTDAFDVGIVVSLDRDLAEIPHALRNLRRLLNRSVRLEAAVPVEPGRTDPKTLSGFAFTHQITEDIFGLVRDDTDYTVGDGLWTPPVLPRSLAQRQGTQ